jgi:hypothetical protein
VDDSPERGNHQQEAAALRRLRRHQVVAVRLGVEDDLEEGRSAGELPGLGVGEGG